MKCINTFLTINILPQDIYIILTEDAEFEKVERMWKMDEITFKINTSEYLH